MIDAAGAAYSISLLQSVRLASMRLDSTAATVDHTGGILDLDGVADLVRGTWRLNGGTIRGGTLAFSTTPTALKFGANLSNTLDGITISGSANFADNFGIVTFRNGLTLAPSSSLSITGIQFSGRFLGDQNLSGGTITLGGVIYNNVLSIGDVSTLSIASNAGVNGAGTLSGVAGSTLANAGLISGNVGTKTLTLSVPTVQNAGTLEARNGGTLNLTGSLANAGLVRADGGTLQISGTASGPGQVLATNNGIVKLSGTVPSGFVAPIQTSAGGVVQLAGIMQNTGAVYQVASGPTLEMYGGTVLNGEMAFGNSGAVIRGQSMTLDGVTLSGHASFNRIPLVTSELAFKMKNGATLGAVTQFVGRAELETSDAATTLSGELRFDEQGSVRVGGSTPTASLTLAPSATLRVAAGREFDARSGTALSEEASTIINQGTIAGGGPSSDIWFYPGLFRNEGTIDLADGSLLQLGSPRTSQRGPLNWTNSGTIRLHNGEVRLSGTFAPSDLQGFDLAGSTALINQATINNTGSTLSFNSTSGTSWVVRESTIVGGTLQIVGSNAMRVESNSTTQAAIRLNGVNVVGDINLSRTTTTNVSTGTYILEVSDGLTLNGTVRAGLGTAIRALGTQTWNGGTIELRRTIESSGSSFLSVDTTNTDANPTLTIGSGMTIKGGRAIILGGATAGLVNHGRIVADTPASTFQVMPSTNHGVLEATSGGALTIDGLENYGTLKVNAGGILNLVGSTAFPIRLHTGTQWIRGAGTVNIIGVLDNTSRTLTLDASSGMWAGRGGRIAGGTVNILSGGGINLSYLTSGASSAPLGIGLDGVTLNGDIVQPSGGGQIRLADSTINGTVTLQGSNGMLLSRPGFDSTPVTLTGGTIVFDSQSTSQVKVLLPQRGTATLSPTTLVRGGGINPGANSTAQLGNDAVESINNTTIVNQGRISADVAGRVITVRPNIFRNEGIAEATNGGILELGYREFASEFRTAWTNPSGIIRATNGGEVRMNGVFTTASMGAVETSNGGTIALLGQLDNSNSTLTLSPTFGPLYMSNFAYISGGSVSASAAFPLRVRSTESATLGDVSLVGNIEIGDASKVNIINSFSVDGSILLNGAGAAVSFSGPRTLSGGSIVFSGTNGAERALLPSTSLTLGQDVVIRGGFGRVFTSTTAAIVNNGRISADVSGQRIRIYQQQFTNNGTIEAINGGQIVFVPPGGVEDLAVYTNSSSLAAGVLSSLLFDGEYRQTSFGILSIAVGATGESIASGWLSAESIVLAGSLDVHTTMDTPLAEGTSFNVLRATRIEGRFDAISLPWVPSPMRWDTSRLYVDGSITVVPTPSGTLLVGFCLGAGLLRRKRS